VFFLRFRSRVVAVAEVVGEPAYGIALLAEVLGRLEGERFTGARLLELRAALDTEGAPPSQAIARLDRLMDLLHSRDNVAVRIVGPPLLWTTQVAFAIEAWRKKYGSSVRRWLAAVGEIETLSAFGGYAYEHPADPFPEFVEGPACFEGEGLGHPLLPESRSVRNDIRLSIELRVQVVSGSNMSGKSTLLRTIGVNAVLAHAGAPVRARRLRLTPLAVGASIRTLDSLQGGTSRFYTEIKRLRQLVDLARGPRPVLFLLDELLHGTNSHDRKIGSEAVIRTLVERGAIGLLTTHDLALAQIVDELAPRAANVHFEDHLENGKITFDYRLHPGLVRKSNALELMRSVGLDV
jgi:DNA mismatch repair ATPase MutS